MTEFSFRSLVPPGAGAKQALAKHIAQLHLNESRRADPAWSYSGVGQLLLEHGTFFSGRELPDRWRHAAGSMGQCHHNSLEAALQEPELRYFTGLYMVGLRAIPHSWCVDDEGLVELTYPTTVEAGQVACIADEFGRATGVPWLPPNTWAYVGVEYDPAFVKEHADLRGLPIFDPHAELTTPFGCGSYRHDEPLPMWLRPYHRNGFPVTPAPTLEWEEEDEDDDEDYL